MKNNIWLISALLLIMSSCASTPPATNETQAEEKVETVKEEILKTVIIDVYLVLNEISSSSDGIIDGYIEYKYDQEGNLLEKKELDSEKKQLNRMENFYSGSLAVKTQWFSGEEDKPGIYIEREFSGINPVIEKSIDLKGISQSISEYEYDNDQNVVKWIISSGDNVPMIVTEYTYEKGLKKTVQFLTPLGEPEGSIEYTWNDGKIESEKTFDSDGELERSIEYEYINGNLLREIHYKKNRIDHSIEYELDVNGNVAVKKYFYKSGNLKTLWSYEYISVKKEVQQ